MCDKGYVNYFEILGLDEHAKPGDVRKTYRRRMKELVGEIARVEITEERRAHYLLEMAKFNAALYVLRDTPIREAYWEARQEVIDLERQWRESEASDEAAAPKLRRTFDRKVRDFLSKYVEELMLDAGRDKECVDASHWDVAHERHAFRILRHYRHRLYKEILERLPLADVTPLQVDWDKRARVVRQVIAGSG